MAEVVKYKMLLLSLTNIFCSSRTADLRIAALYIKMHEAFF